MSLHISAVGLGQFVNMLMNNFLCSGNHCLLDTVQGAGLFSFTVNVKQIPEGFQVSLILLVFLALILPPFSLPIGYFLQNRK